MALAEQRTVGAATRRELLRCGLLSLPGLAAARAVADVAGPAVAGTVGLSPIRACILIFPYGGPSHLDTFDPKPNAPAEVRGEFQTIATAVPGLRISEHLPYTARVMDRVALVRSMHHANRLHDSASIETLTGRKPPQGDIELFSPMPQVAPSYGSLLSYFWRARGLDVPFAALPFVFRNVLPVPCQGGGVLGKAYDPFQVQVDPATQTYRAELLAGPEGVGPDRRERRRVLHAALDEPRSEPLFQALANQYEKAFTLLESRAVREALDVSRVDPRRRERYGIRTGDWAPGPTGGGQNGYARTMRGQNLLVACRLVEAGVPFVNVYDFQQQGQNWDAHAQNFAQHREHLLPPLDRAFSALIEDLEARGLLESTLVVVVGEFGRTPRINASAGRDHWPDCYTAVLAGGGVRGGAVHGASDRLGAYPASDPATPADLAATIFWRFGIDPRTEYRDSEARPFAISTGEPMRGLFG